jgi:TatA/E family protein of Tat protein translocase
VGRRSVFKRTASAESTMFGLGAGEILIILVIAFLLFGPKQLPEIGRQVGKAVKGFKETADDLKKTVEPELNMIQQEMKMVEQDFESSMKEAEEEINQATSGVEREVEESGLPKQA